MQLLPPLTRDPKVAAREAPAGEHLPYARHIDDVTIQTRDGLLMQTILANPLASPFTLGFSAAAGFGGRGAAHTAFANVCPMNPPSAHRLPALLEAAAQRIEAAVQKVLAQGLRTGDIWSEGTTKVGTAQMGDAVVKALA